jgi:protein SCO1/2
VSSILRRIASLAAVLAAVALVAACGSGSSATTGTGSDSASASGGGRLDAPAVLTPSKPAPDFRLRDSLGHPVSLSQYRAQAVLLTFIYDHCPDVCPLIVSNLHNALAQLGPHARRAQVVAVSVDPKGDTPASVRAFLAAHEMTGRMEYLIGSRRELAPVWRKYGVGVKSTPDAREVDHSAVVYGITGSGRVTGLYPANFRPEWIAHDVPLLAAR